MGKILQPSKLFIQDECTTAYKKALEALDHTLKGLKGNQLLFSGAIILLPGDFRQILPVI